MDNNTIIYRTLSEEAVLTIAQLTMEKEQLMEKIDCVETELFEAVQVAYYRGATEWARLNYPNWIDRLTTD
jgi:hypothetical protein